MIITVRLLQEADLPLADRIFRLARHGCGEYQQRENRHGSETVHDTALLFCFTRHPRHPACAPGVYHRLERSEQAITACRRILRRETRHGNKKCFLVAPGTSVRLEYRQIQAGSGYRSLMMPRQLLILHRDGHRGRTADRMMPEISSKHRGWVL